MLILATDPNSVSMRRLYKPVLSLDPSFASFPVCSTIYVGSRFLSSVYRQDRDADVLTSHLVAHQRTRVRWFWVTSSLHFRLFSPHKYVKKTTAACVVFHLTWICFSSSALTCTGLRNVWSHLAGEAAVKCPVGLSFSEGGRGEMKCVSGGAERRVGIQINWATDGGLRLQLCSYCVYLLFLLCVQLWVRLPFFFACLLISHAGREDDPNHRWVLFFINIRI